MPLSLLTETQRQTLKILLTKELKTDLEIDLKEGSKIIARTKSTPKERMIKSRILKELQNTNIIEDISNDLELLNSLVNKTTVRPTLMDLLIIEGLNKLPDCDIDFIVDSVKLLKNKIEYEIKNAIKDASGDFEITDEILNIIHSGTQIGNILRLLSEQLERSTFIGENKYFTQKEIMEELNLPIATISKHLKELIEKGLVEREENSSPYRYCCSETTD